MIFDGMRFQRTQVIVPLWASISAKGAGYMVFGKVIAEGKKVPVDAIDTGRRWKESRSPVYAMPIPVFGHSCSNLANGTDGRMYLCLDGICYSRPYKIPPSWLGRLEGIKKARTVIKKGVTRA